MQHGGTDTPLLHVHLLHTAATSGHLSRDNRSPPRGAAGGGSVLMVSYHHSIIDNSSMMQFMDAWVAAVDLGAQQQPTQAEQPVFGRQAKLGF